MINKILANLYLIGYSIDRIIHIFSQVETSFTVISVGNITAGGAGKSTFTSFIVERLLSYGLNPVIVSRGYKAIIKKNCLVPPNADPIKYGDEPVMLRESCNVPVLIGKRREKSIINWSKKYPESIFIMDDGFQYYRLKRDLNIVLIDSTEPFENYRLIPKGHAREPLWALKRADCIVLTRAEIVERSRLEYLKGVIRGISEKIPIFEAETVIKCWKNALYKRVERPEMGNAFCAIGNPKAFKKLLEMEDIKLNSFKIYDDHHNYSYHDFKENTYRKEKYICTEKDIVKIRRFLNDDEKRNFIFPKITFSVSNEFLIWFASRIMRRELGR